MVSMTRGLCIWLEVATTLFYTVTALYLPHTCSFKSPVLELQPRSQTHLPRNNPNRPPSPTTTHHPPNVPHLQPPRPNSPPIHPTTNPRLVIPRMGALASLNRGHPRPDGGASRLASGEWEACGGWEVGLLVSHEPSSRGFFLTRSVID